MKKVFWLAILFLISVSLNIGGTPQALAQGQKITLSYADYAAPGYDQLKYIEHFIKRIHEETKGRVEIKLYPAEQLVKSMQQYEALMQGTIDMCNITPAYYGGKIPLLMLTNESVYWEPTDSIIISTRIHKEISQIFAKDGIKYLGWTTEQPPVVTVGPKVFKTFDDYKGMKIRAPGKSGLVINKWGGTGVSIPAPDLYMAIQNKVVDGAFLSAGTLEGTRLWEVSPAVTTTTTGGTPQMACMNMKKWESLPDDVKKAFEKVNREMVPWAYKHATEYNRGLDDMMKKKFKLYHLRTPEEHKKFALAADGAYYKPLIQKYGAPAQAMWDKILAAAKECDDARKKGKTPPFFVN